MTRNLSTLEFQRRLIRTALQSPRGECMNLLGIVYSNLEEFIVDRLPFDSDLDRTMDHLSEVFSLLEMAVARKFTNLYIENLPENWETALDLLYGKDNEDMTAMAAMREDYLAFTKKREMPGVLTNDGQKFVSRAFLVPDLISATKLSEGDVDKNVINAIAHGCSYTLRSSGLRLSRKVRGANGSIKGAHMVNTKFTDASNSRRARNIAVRFIVKDTRPMVEARSFVTDAGIINHKLPVQVSERANNFVYQIVFDNPLMLHFNKTAAMIIAHYRKSPKYPLVAYKPDTLGFGGMRGIRDTISGSVLRPSIASDRDVRQMTEFMRGPFTDDYLLQELSKLLHFDAYYLNRCYTVDEVANAARAHKSSMQDAYIMIYRTDPISQFSSSFNLKFLHFLAALLGDRLHIVIECRAHRDEANNVALYQSLSRFNVDIRAGAASNGNMSTIMRVTMDGNSAEYNKLHAKVWAFTFTQPIDDMGNNVVELFSTGNFTSAAQQGFVDSYLITRRSDGRMNSGYMFELIFGAYRLRSGELVRTLSEQCREVITEAQKDDKFIFLKKEIRRTLLDHINNVRRSALFRIQQADASVDEHRPAIFIKVNHITDPRIIHALCDAADAGVDVQVCARTSCTLPLNARIKRISVNSVCGKYLEHDRWFIFGYKDSHGDFHPETCYMSSADLMPRNLDSRLEFMYRIDDGEKMTEIANCIYAYCNLATDRDVGYFNYDLIP